MPSLISFIFIFILVSCGQQKHSRKTITLDSDKETEILFVGVENVSEIKKEAARLDLEVSGQHVLVIKGNAKAIEQLEFVASKDFEYLVDEPISASRPEGFTPDSAALYLAKKEFGIPEFLRKHPQADGRGVIVGIIDDGISPHQQGFQMTTAGERKFLRKSSQSTFTTFSLDRTSDGYEAFVIEKRPSYEPLDLNADGVSSDWKIHVDKDGQRACLDINLDEKFTPDECAGSFSTTGQFIKAVDKRLVLMVEIDVSNKKIQLFQPERGEDSHGEGVAAVLAGHKIGNLPGFDGVAPGAKIVDYDLSEVTDLPEEKEYTLGTFLKALEWVALQGAEVANISYSLHFTSVRTQTFMSKAIDEIVKKHNLVISFSAGNNGPGLGSLNRRTTYPSSVLVAGAFVSKELDERVHGVTGVPEEGRVIYYSSRGPGLGVGPVLISPLSSLVNSSPDSGHRAFSGTSSASPALAGAATVLISSIKQEGLKVDAATVVNALRLSGKRLRAEPFIFQGYGLPQVEDALRIYKELISGAVPMDVNVAIDRETVDGISPKGIFIKTSETKNLTSRKISLTGILSREASAEARVNLLTPVKISYSKGVTGPQELWISSSASNLFVDINPLEALEDKLESFGEITITSALDQKVLAIVPVTIVHDQNVLQSPSAIFRVSAQEGQRFPVHVPPGVRGIRIKSDLLEGDEKTAVISVFDPHHVRLIQQRSTKDIWIPVTESGFYQVGISMGGGTPRGITVKVSIDLLNLKLKTLTSKAKAPKIVITNNMSTISAVVRLKPLPEMIDSVLLTSKELANGASIEKNLLEGNYSIDFTSTEVYDLAYLYSTCTIREKKNTGEVTLKEGTTIDVDSNGTFISARCMPFDTGAVFGSSSTEWIMKILKNKKGADQRLDLLRDQTTAVEFPETVPGKYLVEIVDPFSEATVLIGEVELI